MRIALAADLGQKIKKRERLESPEIENDIFAKE